MFIAISAGEKENAFKISTLWKRFYIARQVSHPEYLVKQNLKTNLWDVKMPKTSG